MTQGADPGRIGTRKQAPRLPSETCLPAYGEKRNADTWTFAAAHGECAGARLFPHVPVQLVTPDHVSGGAKNFVLRLYVAGDTPSARRAIESRTRLLDALSGELDIEIVDILQSPAEAETAGILATPTLSDESVSPPRRLIGDIGNVGQVLEYFGYREKDAAS